MLNRMAGIILTTLVLAAAAHAMEADQPPGPKASKSADQPTPGRPPESKALPATPAPATNVGGATVFLDPATGQIVQPTSDQIGTLAPPVTGGPKPRAPVTALQGPGGAIGMVLTPDSYSYSVATRTPDGKLAMDCVTGEQTAKRMVAGESSNEATPKTKGPLDEKK